VSQLSGELVWFDRDVILKRQMNLGNLKKKKKKKMRRLQRAETVLRLRTKRVVIVLENLHDPMNKAAICRTADALGIQNVWSVETQSSESDASASSSTREQMPMSQVTPRKFWGRWLTLLRFKSIDAFVEEARKRDLQVWSTEVSKDAEPLDRALGTGVEASLCSNFVDDDDDDDDNDDDVRLRHSTFDRRQHVALVFGREVDGVSKQMSAVADRRVYWPLRGFVDSFNVSVCAALMSNAVLEATKSEADGGMLGDDEIESLRHLWYRKLVEKRSGRVDEELLASMLDQHVEPLDDLRVDDRTPRVLPNVINKRK
jgi:tRNA (guanosine-2'-O-)-methyltransferase